MNKAMLYLHGKGGSASEAALYREVCAGYDLIGVDYKGQLPWEVQPQIRAAYDQLAGCGQVSLIANSIGAYFAMGALQDCPIEKALFISPIVDMQQLILRMIGWAGVSEQELAEKGEILTDFGETLSWAYLCFVRENPIVWRTPTAILYAGGDHLVPRQTVETFARAHHAALTVMEEGEHWFHTQEQMAFLYRWMREAL